MTAPKRGPGRPKGSKNKPKPATDLLNGPLAPAPGGVTGVGAGGGAIPGPNSAAVRRTVAEGQKFSSPLEKSDVKDEGLWEPLALLTRNRFFAARMARASERLGDTSVDVVLQRCYQQISGIADPALIEAIEATGVDLILNISENKVDAWEAWSRSIITDTPSLPFTIEPSPNPDLSERAKDAVLQQLKYEMFASGNPVPENLPQFVRQLKDRQREIEKLNATYAADNMMRLISDQANDGGFRPMLLEVIRDMATYPYCAIEGPIPTVIDTLEWRGNRLVKTQKVVPKFYRRSPFDVYWTQDSPDTQQGTAMFIVERVTRAKLLEMARMRSYIGRNIANVLERYATTNRDWLNRNPENPSSLIPSPWGNDQTIEIVTMYARMSGAELRPYGYSFDAGQFFEVKVRTVGPYAIQVLVNRSPTPFTRPIYTATLTSNGHRIAGRGLCQKLRDIERAYMAALRDTVRNNHFSAGPIGEVDYQRISRYMDQSDIGNIDPFTVYPTDPDMSGGGRPAHTFHTVPNVTQQLLAVMQYFSNQADRYSQIPAAFHGEAVGTGVNRTFRGVTLLQGNALKGLQASLTNLGTGILTPCIKNLYNFNMLYSDDESVKGDTRPVVSDISGLLNKEVAKQEALERLQFVAQVAQAGGVSPAVAQWVTEEALIAAGTPIPKIDSAPSKGLPAGPAQQPVVPPNEGGVAPDISPGQ